MTPLPVLRWVWLGLLAWALAQPASAQENAAFTPSKTLDQIQRRGTVLVGVKTDFPPFGQLDPQGQAQGLEVDLAHDLARRLGVRAAIVNVSTENRFQKLEQGDIDVMIATAADTQERRQIATAIEPNYYAGGVTVLLRPNQRAQDWQALRGQKICATQGAYFNRPMQQRYLLELVLYRNTRDALLALRDGRCMGYLYASAAVQAHLKKDEWRGYKAPLPPALVAPWALFIARSEKGSTLEQTLGDTVAQWHREGFLIDREAAWGVQPTRFLADTQALWNQKDAHGQALCARDAHGQWPAACRNPAFVRSDQVGGLQAWGLWVRENLGLNLSLVYDPFDRAVFLRGLGYSLALMAACVGASLLLGSGAAWLVERRWPLVGRCVRALAIYGRMTPPLLQMYLLFFGVGTLLWQHGGISLSPFAVAVACLSYYTGATVMTILLDAADHQRAQLADFRLDWHQMPHLIELTAGPIKAALTNVLKQSIMASAIAIPELLSATIAIIADQGNMNVMMNAFMLCFLGLISAWIWVFDRMEQRARQRNAA